MTFMKKREWMNPIFSFSPVLDDGGEGEWSPEGSGQSTTDLSEWTYEEWLEVYKDYPDILKSGSWEDYSDWYYNSFGVRPEP